MIVIYYFHIKYNNCVHNTSLTSGENTFSSIGLYLQLFIRGLVSYLHYLCLFAYSVVQHILCCVVYFSPSFVPYVWVSLGCPFFIVPSVFSNVYSAIFLTNNKSCCGIGLWKYVIIATGKNDSFGENSYLSKNHQRPPTSRSYYMLPCIYRQHDVLWTLSNHLHPVLSPSNLLDLPAQPVKTSLEDDIPTRQHLRSLRFFCRVRIAQSSYCFRSRVCLFLLDILCSTIIKFLSTNFA